MGNPVGIPIARTTTRSRRRGPCCGPSAAWRSTRTARPSGSTRPPPCRRSSGTRRCSATAWSPRCCPGRTPATTSRSSRARRAGSTTRSAPTSSPSRRKLRDRRRHQPPPEPGRAPRAPRDGRAAPHRHLEVLQEHRAVQGVDPLSPRQARGLRRVHHVGRRLQPARVREAPGPPGAQDRSRSTPRSRARACSTTPTAGRRPPSTRSSSSPTPIILPNMIAKAVTGTSTKDAIAWAENEMKKILAG